jgi:hypothetical protein
MGMDLDGLDAGTAKPLLEHSQVSASGVYVGGTRTGVVGSALLQSFSYCSIGSEISLYQLAT